MEIPRITPQEAMSLMQRGERVLFLDSRSPNAWGSANQQIAGAMRVPVERIAEVAGQLPRDATVVAYCT